MTDGNISDSGELDCLYREDCTWMDTILDPYTSLLGEPVVGMVAAGVLVVSFYLYNDDLAMPTVISLLLGSVLMTMVPGDLQQAGIGFMIIGGVAGAMEVWRRYVL
ncbi:hypothetical protein [Natrinema ejinorense]|uniref:Uncharacterized protein n=1 Tax=Natrinema ejinorense TaxID=373386 RepID=A0A2A5QRI5_9EURY|nr:hypothetical protein [Natrinema ejinorense]PCR89432.1 hypothetical protein CP557_02100 [Natrinema ejinorense]